MRLKHIKQLQRQSKRLKVQRVNKRTLRVESQSDPAVPHTVRVQFQPNGIVHAQCDCEWARIHGTPCTHVMAALEHLAEIKGRRLSYWLSSEDARKQKHRVFYLVGRDEHSGLWITSRAA